MSGTWLKKSLPAAECAKVCTKHGLYSVAGMEVRGGQAARLLTLDSKGQESRASHEQHWIVSKKSFPAVECAGVCTKHGLYSVAGIEVRWTPASSPAEEGICPIGVLVDSAA